MADCTVESKEGRNVRLHEEVELAIKGVLAETTESDGFKRRFAKLISSFFEKPYLTLDLEDTIDLIILEAQQEGEE